MMYFKLLHNNNGLISSNNITDHLIPPTTLDMFYWNETGSAIEKENISLTKLVQQLNCLRSNTNIPESDKTKLESELLEKIRSSQNKITELTLQMHR